MMTYALSLIQYTVMKTISFGGTYSSYSASEQGDEAGSINFYQDFIKADLFRSAKIVSWQIKQQQLGKNTKPFTVYIIQVVTSDIEYRVERRYSCFRNLYKRMSKTQQKSSYFPKMTLFSSGVDQAVVSQRFRSLNQFIVEVLNQHKEENLIAFFQFIEIRSTYEREGISLPNNDSIKGSIEDQLAELMIKLSYEYEQAVNILNEIQKKLLQSRMKISGQLIKIAYLGLGKRPGLLSVCTHASNEMVCFRILEIILKLTSFEHNRQAEMYCKGLANCPVDSLLIDECLLEYSKVKINYFRVLDIYFKRNNELNLEDIVEKLFYKNNQTIRQFNLWLKTQQKSSIMVQRMDERSPDRRSEIIQKLKQVMRREDNDFKVLKRLQGKIYRISLEKFTSSIFRIIINCDSKNMVQLKNVFIDSSPWNSMKEIVKEGSSVLKVSIFVSPKTSQQFLFEQQISVDKTHYQRIRKPPVYLRNALSFFQITRCYDNKTQIYYNLNTTKKLKDVFNESTLYYFCELILQQQ